jgi:tetratricopeptide (TPR) repeat protein
MVYLLRFFWVWCLVAVNAQPVFAQKKYNMQAQRIDYLLEHQKVDQALQELDKLVDAYPQNVYYAELQISVLQQILEKIHYVKDDADSEETIDDNPIPTHLRLPVKPIVHGDDTAVVGDTPPIAESNFDDIVMDTSNMPAPNPQQTLSKKEIRQKARRLRAIDRSFASADDQEPLAVEVDSTMLDELAIQANFDKQVEANAPEPADITTDVKSNVNQAADDTAPLNTKAHRAALRRQRIIAYYAAMDARVYHKMLIDAARKITLRTEGCDSASAILYRYYVDTFDKHKEYKQSAIDLLEEGDESFMLMEYGKALTQYNAAMGIEPEFYAAYIKMADAYARLREDSMAIVYYNAAIELRPKVTDAYFRLANYFYKKGEFQQSLDFTLICILLYPEQKFFTMVKSIAQQTAHEFKSQWQPREVFPILPGGDIDEILASEKSPWLFYQAAKRDFGSYAEPTGLLRFNELSAEKYLEVNAWINMLDSVKDLKQFEFARQMRKIGYLDCYVLITMFHHDVYQQYRHLVESNPAKVKSYLKMLSEWEKKKYDALRALPDIVPPEPAKEQKDATPSKENRHPSKKKKK